MSSLTASGKLIVTDASISSITQDVEEVLLLAFQKKQFDFFNRLIMQLSDPSQRPGGHLIFQNLLRNLPGSAENEVMVYLIQFFCDMPLVQAAIDNLRYMYQIDKDMFKFRINIMVGPKYNEFLSKAITANFPDSYKHIIAFSCGRGRIDYDAGLVAIAAISFLKKKEDIEFNPTLLKGNYELKMYFEFIRDNLIHLGNKNFKFVVCDLHWISGVVEIKNGKPCILFVDSRGENSVFLGNPKRIAKEVFYQNDNSVESNIIVAVQERQSALMGCSVFALDDVRKLFKTTEMSQDLNQSMLRTTESLRKIANYKMASPEKFKGSVNSRNLTFDDSLNEHLKLPVEGSKNMVNMRIDHKLKQLCEKVTCFVSDKSDETIAVAKQDFTLEKFKSRLKFL